MPEPPVPPRPVLPPGLATVYVARVRAGWSDPRVRVGALLLGAAIAGFVWFRIGSDGGVQPVAASNARPGASRQGRVRPPSTRAGPSATVHVAGAVARPGVVRVPAGARVVDALAAAGGGLPDADLDRLNLAAKVVDGQRIAVPHLGAPAVGGLAAGPDGAGDPGGLGDGPLDLNTASAAQLEALPGIGPSLAAAIVAEREKRGGFRSVGELRDVRGIGERRFADLEHRVTV